MTTDVMELLERALLEAGDVLMSHYGRLEQVDRKSDIDFVTQADRESEKLIKRLITESYPEHAILAEESGATAGSSIQWIIDPLDGTTNFAHGFPMFSVSIAVLEGEDPIGGGVYNPYYGEMFLASRGDGAFLDGERIRVSTQEKLADCLAVTGFPYDRRERLDHYLAGWAQFLNQAQGVLRLGSAALDLCSVACGRLDIFWEEKLHPWDTAAGWLIVQEAGGKVTDFRGDAFSPFGKQVLATNGRVHHECITALQPLL